MTSNTSINHMKASRWRQLHRPITGRPRDCANCISQLHYGYRMMIGIIYIYACLWAFQSCSLLFVHTPRIPTFEICKCILFTMCVFSLLSQTNTSFTPFCHHLLKHTTLSILCVAICFTNSLSLI